ncbi:tripartite tricarboxylate transporter substrate binding protein [Noviherbaspirillum sedimenti]|uniref:Tripartite tricarboxylate transporter substrate binding protein n=2 Tax=Noviherbaspirillum sedimenti TaxID=2320865 RepID=A0A3A3G441_9BURK|nr:tripartite tricarboxylate transporter substrate binding protein [Noviherbaspirillum sedimenti]
MRPQLQHRSLSREKRYAAPRDKRLFGQRVPVAIRWLPVLALTASGLAQAQDWPSKPVRIVVPIAAGSATDLLARMVGQALSETTGQPFVIDNKSGAVGAIGSNEVARAPADGYTLLIATTSTHAIAPHVSTKLPYNAVKDFTPIAFLTEANNLLVVSPTLPVKNVKELLALAREKPGYLNYVSSGVGSFGHLSFELLAAQTGVSFTHVPYKGTGAALQDLMSGAVHMALEAIPSALPKVKSGMAGALAVSGAHRSAIAPDIPTIAESGVPGFSVQSWFGLYGPRGMPPELTQRINEKVNKMLQSPNMVVRFQAMGIEAGRGSPADFAAMVANDSARWGRIAKERNIKME